MQNLSSIVWLYRGQRDRFLNLVKRYVGSVCEESRAIPEKIAAFEKTLSDLRERLANLVKTVEDDKALDAEKKKALMDAAVELADAEKPYEADRSKLIDGLAKFFERFAEALPAANEEQHSTRKIFDPIVEEIKGLIKQIDLLYKLTARVVDLSAEFPYPSEDDSGDGAKVSGFRTARRLLKQLDEERKDAVGQLKQAPYFHRQIVWLQDRFPEAELQPVPGLVKLVNLKEIEAADWSLTPGRYVGVAPPEEDEDFDFEQTLRDIHTELVDLNKEAAELAGKVHENFEELGV
jgi:type I restriction enzyme M protein